MHLKKLQPVVVAKNVVNVHAEPSTDTEQVTQAIAGQPAWVIETRDRWQRVQLWDTYQGWMQQRFTVPLEDGDTYPVGSPIGRVKALIADALKEPKTSAEIVTKLVFSTTVDVMENSGRWVRARLPDSQTVWVKSSDIALLDEPLKSETPPSGGDMVRLARKMIGTPYLWGGTTPFGIDCSGFVQLLHNVNGYTLLRDANIQATDPRAVAVDPEKLRAGDLVFFCGATDTRRERITHVGLYIGNGEFIHSAGQSIGVTISPLFSGYYWDVFWGARRMTPGSV